MARVSFTTPVGVARFPKLTKPDTTGDYADNKYKTDLILTDAELDELEATFKKFAAEGLPGAKNPHLPISESKNKETGEVVRFVRFKSARKPILIDSKRNRLPENVEVAGGSKIRVAGTLNCYEKGGNKGVNIYLNAVQVIDLQQGFNVDDFDDEEGYVAEESGGNNDDTSEFDL